MLAIVIPYYKRTFFEETLQSLAVQTDKRFHVYVGDDGSPEDPNPLLEKYREKIDFVYRRFEKNIGGISLAKQWVRCIEMTQDEEWLMILGDDDVLGNNTVEEFYHILENNYEPDFNIYKFNSLRINGNGEVISPIFYQPAIQSSIDFILSKFEKKNRGSLTENIFKMNAISKIKIRDYPLAWHSDDMLMLEVSNFGLIFGIENAYISIRISNQSITGGNYIEEKIKAEKYFLRDFIRFSRRFNKIQKRRLLKILIRKLYVKKRDLNRLKNLIYFFFYNSIIK